MIRGHKQKVKRSTDQVINEKYYGEEPPDLIVSWYILYGFVVGREVSDNPRYWFHNYIVLPQ